jgi:hypothetical protein
LKIRRLNVLIEQHGPAKEQDDQQVNDCRNRKKTGGKNGPEKPVKMGLGRVWHLFWLGKEGTASAGRPTRHDPNINRRNRRVEQK